MSVQWDDPERVGHFIRLLERECKAWQGTADGIEALLPDMASSRVEEAQSRMRECRARAEALRRLVRHVVQGDFTLLENPEA